MPAITMICLANSRKHSGRCVAGVTWEEHDRWCWIRPVSSHGTGELNSERFYEDGSEPRLLDVIDLSILKRTPTGCHAEDTVIDPSKLWHKQDSLTYHEALDQIPISSTPLWINGKRTSHGLNDVMNEPATEKLSSSLMLISPRKLTMTATQEDGKRKVRGEFWQGNLRYKLAVTDPWIEDEFAEYEVGDKRSTLRPLLCISISMVFELTRSCYKLIAGVIEA